MGKTLGLDKSGPRREVVRLLRRSGSEVNCGQLNITVRGVPLKRTMEVIGSYPDNNC